MDYILDLATQSDLSAVCHLIDERIRWMDAVGIRQWNVTDYWGVYPRSHYEELVRLGQLYVLRQRPHGKIAGAAALYETDPRWQGLLEIPAYYVHHFAADEAQKGAGAVLLSLIEELGARRGKAAYGWIAQWTVLN